MLDTRQHALAVAALAGVAVAALGWLVFGSTSLDRRLSPLEDGANRLEGYAAPRPVDGAQAAAAARSAPLFARPASAGAPPVARLQGVAVRAGGRSALLSIGGSQARWMKQGETSGQLTLVGVGSSSVVIETPDGRTTLRLGETSAGHSLPPTGSGPIPTDQIPPGFRQPPPSASAPGV